MAAQAGLFLLLAAGGPVLAQPPGAEHGGARITVDARATPWSSLVRVQAPGLARCTGFLVAPDRVATAAHCLYSARLGRFIPPQSVHVLLGYDAGRHAGHARVATYRLAEGYDPRRTPRDHGADVAVLALARGLPAPWLVLGEAAPGTPVVLGGYNRDRAEVIAADLACRVSGRAQDGAGRALLAHDCAGTFGTSGAPLLQRDAAGQWRAVGVQVAGQRAHGPSGPVSYAVPATAIAAILAVLP